MIDVVGSLIGFGLLIALMFVGLHVATAVFFVALLGASLYLGMPVVNAFRRSAMGRHGGLGPSCHPPLYSRR